jgi:hypothetical protein
MFRSSKGDLRLLARRVCLAAAIAASGAGCSASTPAPAPASESAGDDAFLLVKKGDTSSSHTDSVSALAGPTGLVSADGEDFYIAIKKSELDKLYFLSAHYKQLAFDTFSDGPGHLGSRIVSFKAQDGKLFVYDHDPHNKTSDAYNPEVILDAFPIVDAFAPFDRLLGSERYILFDPSAGLNRYDLVAESLVQITLPGNAALETEIDVSYAQRFRKLADGVAFDRVFAGSALSPSPTTPRTARLSGTLGIAIRRYSEGEGFTPSPFEPYYFHTTPVRWLVDSPTNHGATKWNIRPGMKPIVWAISPNVARMQSDPKYAAYDLVGAVKRGIEGWNAAFGFKALEARAATAGEQFGDDDVNYFIWDDHPTADAAYGTFDTNPSTGEIRNALVFMPDRFFTGPLGWLPDDASTTGTTSIAALRATLTTPPKGSDATTLAWSGMQTTRLCDLSPRDLTAMAAAAAAAGPPQKKEMVESYVTALVLHEIGHTLGLRHNFKGSLVPPSSSAMEYSLFNATIQRTTPGVYDVAAIHHLYGLGTETPASYPFCTDNDRAKDPMCVQFDAGADPVREYWPYLWDWVVSEVLAARPITSDDLGYVTNALFGFARAGATPAIREVAVRTAFARVAAPVAADVKSDPYKSAVADAIAEFVLARLYLAPAAFRGPIVADPPADVSALIVPYARDIIANADGIRSFPARRTAIDTLKAMQHEAALAALVEAREGLVQSRASATGGDALEIDDLVARVDAAMKPYFVR